MKKYIIIFIVIALAISSIMGCHFTKCDVTPNDPSCPSIYNGE